MAKPVIIPKMSFMEVLKKYPQTHEVFMKFGMHCCGCPVSAMETLEQGACAHDIDVKKLIAALNKAVGAPKK